MTLSEAMSKEFTQGEYDDTKAYKFRDEIVLKEHILNDISWKPWIGKHKNVTYWVELINGYCVGFNESPARGWSFPVIRKRKKQ